MYSLQLFKSYYYFKYYMGWKPSITQVLFQCQILISVSVKKWGQGEFIVLHSRYGKSSTHSAFFGKGSRRLLYQMFWKEGNCGIGRQFQTGAFYWFSLNIHGLETFCLWLSIFWVWHTSINGFLVVFLRVRWWCFCCIWHSVCGQILGVYGTLP